MLLCDIIDSNFFFFQLHLQTFSDCPLSPLSSNQLALLWLNPHSDYHVMPLPYNKMGEIWDFFLMTTVYGFQN